MKKSLLFVSLFLFFVFAQAIHASENDFIISEIMYDWPGSDSTHEWVEVYNSGNDLIEVLTGSGNSWRFFDGSNHVLNLIQGVASIIPNSYFVIADNATQFLIDYPNFVGTLFDTSLSLGNSGDDLALSADAGQNYFAQTNYQSAYGAAGTGNSLEKINLNSDDTGANWHESSVIGGTPGTANSIVSEIPDILAPQANAICPTVLSIGEVGLFDASSSTDPQNLPLNFLWNFGDNTTANDQVVEHFYTVAGNYTVVLTADNGSLNNSVNCLLEVTAIDGEEEIPDDESENNNGGGGADAPPLDSYLQISEFLPNPIGTDTEEWIELYNGYHQAIDLAGYKLQDNSARIFTINEDNGLVVSAGSYLLLPKSLTGISLNNTGGDSVKFYNPDDEEIEIISYTGSAPEGKSFARQGSGFLWSAAPTPGSANQFLDNQPPTAEARLKSEKLLVGEKIILSAEGSTDPEEGELVYSWDFGDETIGDEIIENHIFQAAGNYQVKLTVTDSEGVMAEDSIIINITDQTPELLLTEISPINFSLTDLLITEFIPNPVGSDDGEWIEIYNNYSTEINLKGWQLDDADGGSKPYVFTEDFILAPGEYKIIERQNNKITLNNSDDSVRLLTPVGEIWQEVVYHKIPEGQSYAWDNINQEWFVNIFPTPNQGDFYVESSVSTIGVGEINNLEKNSEAYLQGIALQDADVSSNVLYLADFADGQVNYNQIVEVYFSQKNWPGIKAGDQVELAGKISRIGELPRVKISEPENIVAIAPIENFSQPESIYPDDLTEDILGDYVTVKGVVIKKSGKNIYLSSDKEQESQIRIYNKFDNKDLEIKKDMEIVATGILSQTSSGYKLTVIKSSDVLVPQVLGVAMINENEEQGESVATSQINFISNITKQKSLQKILMTILILGILLTLAYYFKYKKGQAH